MKMSLHNWPFCEMNNIFKNCDCFIVNAQYTHMLTKIIIKMANNTGHISVYVVLISCWPASTPNNIIICLISEARALTRIKQQ